MNWVTVIWSISVSACSALALIHLVIWFQDRKSSLYLLFAIASLGVAGIAVGELAMMHATTPEEFGVRLRWTHVPLFVAIASSVWFVRFYFQAGRRWLAWSTCATRFLALLLNFIYSPNLNYDRIDSVQQVEIFGGSTVSVARGQISARTRIGECASLQFLIFALDAAATVWRRGGRTERRRAIVVGGSMAFFVIGGAGHTALVHAGLISSPYVISLTFLVPVAAMACELGADVVRAGRLARDLDAVRADLRENEQQLELAAAAADLALWRWDIVADKLWLSDKGRTLFGFNPSEKLDLARFLDALDAEDREAVRHGLRKSLESRADYEGEYRLRLADGSTRWLAARGRAEFNGGSTPVLIHGVCFDITRRKQAEREHVRQRNELAHLSRVAMLGELSGSLAHELNQPLTAILANAQAAQQFLLHEPIDINEVKGILQDIVDEDRRAREVIRRLRLLFRKGEVQYETLDLNEVVTEVLKLMHGELVNHGVASEVDLAADLPRVNGDRVQLQQVVINLVANASDAMAQNGSSHRTLCVRTSLGAGNHILLRVADTGCGIPSDRLEQIFEPFHTTKATGMGLGLAVCRTIMSAHKGRLWATNNSTQGASFHVEFPSKEQEFYDRH